MGYSGENDLKENTSGCWENNSEAIFVSQRKKMGVRITGLSNKGAE